MAESIVLTKAANALVEDAAVAIDGGSIDRRLERGVDRVRQSSGGLWVGGRVTLSTEHLSFHPNGVNSAMQTGTLEVAIPLGEVRSVEVDPGTLTKIVVVRTADLAFKVRCFGAAKLAEAIRQAIPEPS
jgi:hypothetical protein